MATESNLPLKKWGPNRIAFFKDGHQPLQIFAGHLKSLMSINHFPAVEERVNVPTLFSK
jgi:hypothetical protein